METKRIAESFGLYGLVRNLTDGRVEIVAEGERENIEKLIDWVGRGPILAKVEKVEVEWRECSDEFSKFEIR